MHKIETNFIDTENIISIKQLNLINRPVNDFKDLSKSY